MMRRATEPDAWPPAWLEGVRRRVRRWCAQGGGNTWVVAVSGGGDSVGLLRTLHHLAPELGLTLTVAHLDHGVRGEAGRADAAFVAELASALGLPFDQGRWQPERPGHFEADARRARYRWLREVAAARGAGAIAVGHTRDDQAETILHRIVRGTGLRGLAGIPARRVLQADPLLVLVRPLLAVSREAVRDSLTSLGQDFREDVSNADLSRTRSRIRHDWLPRLAAMENPRVVEALARLGHLAAASQRLLEHWLDDLGREGGSVCGPDGIELDRDRLAPLPPFLRAELIRRLWREAGWPEAGMSARRWRRIVRLVRSEQPGVWDVGAGVIVEVRPPAGPRLLRRQDAIVPLPAPLPLDLPGSVAWGDGRVLAVLEPDGPRDETIDLDRVVPPLIVRAPAPGDRFAPLGLSGRSMPLNDFFRGRKLDRATRAATPLVCDAEGIVWVAGQRIAERVKLTDSTTRTLGLRWEPFPRQHLGLAGRV